MLIVKPLRSHRGNGLGAIIGNTIKNSIKNTANKITAQKVADAVVHGGVKLAANTAKKGVDLAVKRVFAEKKKKKASGKRVDTINALINGSGIIYD